MPQGYKVTRTNDKSCVATGKYQRLYLPNTIVEAVPGSLGIMFFSKKTSAFEFGISILMYFIIYEVEYEETDKETHSGICACVSDKTLDMFYQRRLFSGDFNKIPPKDTLFAKKVYVKDSVYKHYKSLWSGNYGK